MTRFLPLILIGFGIGCSTPKTPVSGAPLHPLPTSPEMVVWSPGDLSGTPHPLPIDSIAESAQDQGLRIVVTDQTYGIEQVKQHLQTNFPAITVLGVDEPANALLVLQRDGQLSDLAATQIDSDTRLDDIATFTHDVTVDQAHPGALPIPLPPPDGATGDLYIENWTSSTTPSSVQIAGLDPFPIPVSGIVVLQDVPIGTYLVRIESSNGDASERRIAARQTP